MAAPVIDLIGQTFNSLTVLDVQKVGGRPGLLCVCRCGTRKAIRKSHVLSGAIKSCGCLRRSPEAYRNFGRPRTSHGQISGRFFSHIKTHAARRDLAFDIDIRQCWDLYLKQDQRCALTGMALKMSQPDRTASLDRIDSSKGYTIHNIQWVHKTVNLMKMDLPQEDFVDFCKLIARNN